MRLQREKKREKNEREGAKNARSCTAAERRNLVELASFPSEGKAWKRDDLVKHVLKSCLGAGRGCQTLLFPPGEGGAGIMGTPRGGSREGGFAPRRCEPPATQHGSGEKPPRRGRPLAAFPRRRLLALKKPCGAKILRVEAVGGNGRAAAGSGREAFWETRGGGGRRGGENPISSTISTESVGRVPGMEGGRREAPPGLPGDERGRAAARRRRVRAAAPAAGREGARGAAAPGRARRCLRGRPSGKSLAAGRGDRAAPRPHRAAGGRAPAPGYREQPEQLERSEAAASPRAGKEPALLPPPARCPRGSSERTARPREIQTEAGNGENPEHGGKGKRDSRSRLGPPAGFGRQKKRAVGRGAG